MIHIPIAKAISLIPALWHQIVVYWKRIRQWTREDAGYLLEKAKETGFDKKADLKNLVFESHDPSIDKAEKSKHN